MTRPAGQRPLLSQIFYGEGVARDCIGPPGALKAPPIAGGGEGSLGAGDARARSAPARKLSGARAPAPAVFLDRDGVLCRTHVVDGKSYAVRRLADFRLFPGTA